MRIQHFSKFVAFVELDTGEHVSSYDEFPIVVVYKSPDENILILFREKGWAFFSPDLGQPPREGQHWIFTGSGVSTEGCKPEGNHWTREETEALAKRLADQLG